MRIRQKGAIMDKYIMALDQGTTSSRTIIYDKAGNKKVKDATAYLKSSNKKIAKVLKSGRIKGVAAGEATITLKYKGATAKVKVTVTTKSSKKK